MSETVGGDKAVAGALSRLLPAAAVRLDVPVSDWRTAVRAAGDALIASGSTTPAYTDEMIATVESMGPYIVIAPGIALAHARPSPAVLRTGLSLVRLAHPVEFGHKQNDPVRLVVGLASPDADSHVAALASLAGLLSDAGRLAQLLDAVDVQAVQELIARYEQEVPAQ